MGRTQRKILATFDAGGSAVATWDIAQAVYGAWGPSQRSATHRALRKLERDGLVVRVGRLHHMIDVFWLRRPPVL